MATRTLRILREVNNYTQEFVAEEVLGISQNTYSRLEQNPGKITAEQAHKLSALYNVSINNLFSEFSPVINFEDPIMQSKKGEGGINLPNRYACLDELTATALKEHNMLVMQQNMALMELVKALKDMSKYLSLNFRVGSMENKFE